MSAVAMSLAPIDVSRIGRGFANVVLESQAAFQGLMWALSRPGLPRRLEAAIEPPEGLGTASAIALLTLADFATPVYLPPARARGAAGDYLRFHAGCPLVAVPGEAMFALTSAGEAAELMAALPVGEDRYPDRSATLIVEVPALTGGRRAGLTGPGVEREVEIAPEGLDGAFWRAVAANHALYPLGIDLLIAAGSDIVGLPRSVRAALREE
jgi:alpha-D-ribose 1-methylphosphonate 5-triphosphate synthase subunit PhnH